jgi:hypothetical protein
MTICDSCKHKEYCPRVPKDNVKECDRYDQE